MLIVGMLLGVAIFWAGTAFGLWLKVKLMNAALVDGD